MNKIWHKLELKIPPVLFFLLFLIIIHFMPRNAYIADNQPIIYVINCLLLFFIGLILCLLPFIQFLKSKTTLDPTRPYRAKNLVTTGVFRFTRNPIYLGFLFFLIFYCAYLESYSSLFWCYAFTWPMTYLQIIPEERALEKNFGQEFLDYKKTVSRWLGLPTK